jgi:hypothetical protein
VPPKRQIDVPERRARLARRQHLARSCKATAPVEVGRDLVALHSTDPASVFLSIAARLEEPSVDAIERGLYTDRQLVRMLGMRRTMFVVADEMAPVVQAACTRAIGVQLRRRYQQLVQAANIVEDVPTWWSSVAEATVAALERRGEATAQELGNDVPELKTQIRLAEGKSYAGATSIATWMLMVLSAEGRVVRGRPRGTWISSQYRWAPLDGLPEMPTPEAQTQLVRGWLHAFGPGTLDDLKWWSGLTMGEVRRAVHNLDVAEVEIGDTSGLVLTEDADPVPAAEPWVALLPALDPLPMGYAARDWFLGPHAAALFDRSGNIGPSIWSDGRIVGGWAQRQNGAIAIKLLEDVGSEAERSVEAAAHMLGAWIGDVRVTPRFRTPLERELSA